MIPAKFLKKYDHIIIEPDGVVLTDRHYLTCAVLAAYELCNSDKYFGKSEINCTSIYSNQNQIADLLLSGGKLTEVLYDLGIDYPLDIAYVLVSAILGIGERGDFNNIYNYFRYIDLHTPDIFEHCAQLLGRYLPDHDCKRGGEVWQMIKKSYNEWLFGDEFYELFFEEPALQKNKSPLILTGSVTFPQLTLRDIFSALTTADKTISICSLRTKNELKISFERWKFTGFFTPDNVVTYDDIVEAGHLPNMNTPHDPDLFGFARAAVGNSFSESTFENGKYADIFSKTLIVSCSPISLFAAQSLGMGFAAVIRNPSDRASKDMFRQLEADYVLDSILDLTQQQQKKTQEKIYGTD